jgi:hypothetical protein
MLCKAWTDRGLERLLHKDYDRNGSVTKNSGCDPHGAWRQDKLIGGTPPVVN